MKTKPKYTTHKIELMDLKLTHQQQQPPFGVITRARALAMQRAQAAANDSSSYIQLRSRRLQKLNRFAASRKSSNRKKKQNKEEEGKALASDDAAADGEGSFGENVVESGTKERSTRETTPCNLIRNPDALRTPGSTTRHTASADMGRPRNSSVIMPTTQQINDFFAEAEIEDQRRFIEKYNFDIINDKPLPGRYVWEKLDP